MPAESAPSTPVLIASSDAVPSPTSALPSHGGFRRFLALFALNWPGIVLVISAVLSGTVQADMVDDLPTSHGGLYTLVFALTSLLGMPLALKASDLHGKKRILGVACVLGIIGNAITLAAPTFMVALLGHAIAGLYTAAGPLSLFAVRDCFPRKRFPIVLLCILAIIGFFVAVTQAVSGALVDTLGWRTSVGCLIVLTVLAMLLLKAVPPVPPREVRFKDLDVPNRILDATSPMLLTLGVIKGGDWGWTSPATLGTIGVGVVLGVILGMRARAAKRRAASAGTA
ncbi:MFS transporter [Streptomyces tendae]